MGYQVCALFVSTFLLYCMYVAALGRLVHLLVEQMCGVCQARVGCLPGDKCKKKPEEHGCPLDVLRRTAIGILGGKGVSLGASGSRH